MWLYRPPNWPREIHFATRQTRYGNTCVEDRGVHYYVTLRQRRPCRCNRAMAGLECPHVLLAAMDTTARDQGHEMREGEHPDDAA